MPPRSTYKVTIDVDMKNVEDLRRVEQELTKIIKLADRIEKNAGKGFNQLGKSLKKTQIEARQAGRGLQNASYQIQDMIVQISGGVDPMRSFSQQLPQMMINMGALGAVVGVVAAGMPLLIQAFMDGEEEAESFSDSIETLADATGRLNSVSSGIDFTSWNEAWHQANESVRATMLSVLEFEQTVARGALEESIKSLGSTIEGETSILQDAMAYISDFVFGIENSAETLRDINLAESFGVSRDVIDNMQLLVQQFQEGSITAEEMRDQMLAIGAGVEGASPEFNEFVRANVRLVEARQNLAQAEQQIQAARTGNVPYVDDGSAAREAAAAYNELYNVFKQINPEAVKYFEAVELHNQALAANLITQEQYVVITDQLANNYAKMAEQEAFAASASEKLTTENNNLAESFDTTKAAIDIFDRSFQTSLNGVMMGTQSMKDAFTNMAKGIIAELLKLAAYRWITASFGIPMPGVTANAKGNAFSGGNVVPFAKGGVVSGPTIFPMANGAGLMGEAGPEAVMPLTRTSSGNLGVEASGMNVTINNMAPGASVQANQGPQGLTIDVVMDQVTNAIRKGGNDLSSAMEDSYTLSRGRAVY